jgi:hypothetical protein
MEEQARMQRRALEKNSTSQSPPKKIISPLGGLEPPTLRLTAARSNQLSHKGLLVSFFIACYQCFSYKEAAQHFPIFLIIRDYLAALLCCLLCISSLPTSPPPLLPALSCTSAPCLTLLKSPDNSSASPSRSTGCT